MSEFYTNYEVDGLEYYKCVECEFYTKFLSSIKRHTENKKCKLLDDKIICEYCNKEFNYPIDKQRHLNRKKKCYVECDGIVDKQIKMKNDNNINELKKQNNQLLEDNKLLNELIKNKDNKINFKEMSQNENINLIYNKFSNLLLEREIKKKETPYMLIYDLEYNILYNSLTIYKNNETNNKDKLYLLMSIISYEQLIEFFKSVNSEYNYLIEFIIDYYNHLQIINDEYINEKKRIEYLIIIKEYINLYFYINLDKNDEEDEDEEDKKDKENDDRFDNKNDNQNDEDDDHNKNKDDEDEYHNANKKGDKEHGKTKEDIDNNEENENSKEINDITIYEKTFKNEEKTFKQIKQILEIKKSYVNNRPYQNALRQNCIKKYNGKCIISERSELRLLQACHIKPDCLCNTSEKIDMNNMILLWIDLHIFFDDFLLTIDSKTKKVLINEKNKDTECIKIYNNKFIKIINDEMLIYLSWHNNMFKKYYCELIY